MRPPITGVPISDDHFYETYDIPKPDNYEELIATRTQETDPEPSSEEEDDDQPAKSKKAKKKKSSKKKLSRKLTRWDRLRLQLSDFFDRAP